MCLRMTLGDALLPCGRVTLRVPPDKCKQVECSLEHRQQKPDPILNRIDKHAYIIATYDRTTPISNAE